MHQEILKLAGDLKVRDMSQEIYDQVTKPLVDDLLALQKKDPDFTVYQGDRSYSSEDIFNHIKERTVFGESYVANFIYGLKLMNEPKQQVQPKPKKNFFGL